MGITAAITPWNFPFALPAAKCAAALASGCPVILKPSEETPLSALALGKLGIEAGLPPGVLSIIPCQSPHEVSETLLTEKEVRLLTFTGSTETGKHLLKRSADTIKKVSLELGGNCPVLIFSDANLSSAAQKTAAFKCYNAGQCCNAPNRFLVQKEVYTPFIEAFIKELKGADLSPLIHERAILKIEALLADATSKGAKIITGGKRLSPDSLIFPPTVLIGVTPSMKIWHTEIFGPIASFSPFSNEQEGVFLANNTEYGLASYLFTTDPKRMWPITEALETGLVGINSIDVFSETLPFGGWKESGIGREMGLLTSLDDFMEMKSISLDISPPC